ncbi:MATE family efflux transporter [Lachnospira pectinoschiza]|uniref:Putative efflux protein, MATE family n=1 Tax=Lachnospira pectinoschiza TaxID=28052 RepID=A0A1G9U1Y6_9FIRM|nr:MATE family efflux transporter [Lachnospira pectinoschiza]SDM53959.1 putative efflux protein, MATE family [Lachnospira pectinoschiza]
MTKNIIRLSDHFDYKRLLRYSLPSMCMMVLTSIYGVVDGLFVSNVVGKNAFAAINLVMPVLMILGGFGTMFGTGGTALVSMTLGQKKEELANKYFSMVIEVAALVGVTLSVIGFILMPRIVALLGASDLIMENAINYGRTAIIFLVALILQYAFQSFMTAAGKPKLGLYVTVAAGLTNAVLDAVFIYIFRWGVIGAALATGIGQTVGGVIPLIYFIRKNTSNLRIKATMIKMDAVIKSAFNGLSELMTSIASSIVSMVYNLQLMKYAGENGVASYGVLMYVQFIFIGILFGYTLGTTPIVGYHYGAGNKKELNNLLKRSLKLEYIGGVVLFIIAQLLAKPISFVFVGYDAELWALTIHAFRIFLFAFLLAGGNIFISSFFTALNNGPVSALVSTLRSLVFELSSVIILPLIFGLNGIWGAVAVAELAATVVAWSLLIGFNKRYGYFIKKDSTI